METFVEIINAAKVRSNTNLELSGIFANKKEWEKHSFYPKIGVVGVIIAEAQSCEGKILIIHCGDRLIVPILPEGVRCISFTEYNSRYSQNLCVGKMAESQNRQKFIVEELMDNWNNMFGL